MISTKEREFSRKILAEVARRETESLRLYQPMSVQQAFHESQANERIFYGGNQVGKTLAAAVEVARAICGCDPYGKYPKTDGICYAVGKDGRHIGRVLYKKLFKPGAYEIIKDVDTGKWRPALPGVDDAREDEKLAAPPLVPRRMYSRKAIAWAIARDDIPTKITLKNGWEIHFFSSLGEPSQGVGVDLVWFDEEIEHPQWYPEMSARLIARRRVNVKTGRTRSGKFVWSATPQAGTQRLYELTVRADDCKLDDNPPIVVFHSTLFDNSYLSDATKKEFVAKMEGNEDETGIRIYGKFAILGRKVYPEFTPFGVHGVPSFPIPDDWTRYIAVDPGRQVCAVLFAAVPPPSHMHGNKVFIYDELYLRRCSAIIFAERLRVKLTGIPPLRAAIIDHAAGRQTEIGSGRTVEQQYSDALKSVAVSFEVNQSGFIWASDDVQAGLEAVRGGLHIVEGMSTKWIVFNDKVPWMIWEAARYTYKKIPGKQGQIDTPSDEPFKVNNHLMDCWRYLAMHGLKHHYPKKRARKKIEGYTNDILAEKRRVQDGRNMGWIGEGRIRAIASSPLNRANQFQPKQRGIGRSCEDLSDYPHLRKENDFSCVP